MKLNYKLNYKYLFRTTCIVTLIGLGACNTPTPTQVENYSPSNTQTTTPTPSSTAITTPSPIPTQAKLRAKGDNFTNNSKATNKTTKVVLYTIDAECQDFVPQESTVPAEEPINEVVGKVLENNENGDFSISGYRVNVRNGVATIDLRVAPQSKRQIESLSSCENNAIFGSLRKTLTANPQWNIKDVRFTEKGEEIVL